jgi:nucleotide-binding universal stress UspA family protein
MSCTGLRGPATYLYDDAEIKRMLKEAVSLAERYGARKVSEAALEGRADAVVQYARQKGFDHIVTGTSDKRGLCRLALGSVAAGIASKAHCTVTIAR